MSSLIPTIASVRRDDWNSVIAANRDTQLALSTLAGAKLGTGASPTFGTITLTDLTASRLVSTDSAKALESTDLASWLAGTTNRITVTDDGDGTVTLTTPQDTHVDATPEFAGLTIKHSDDTIIMYVDNDEFYVSSSVAIPIATGMPVGLLLTLTYNIP